MADDLSDPQSGAVPRNLDLDLLRTFVLVVETGGFTRAGALIGRSQAAVSLQIQRLEDQVRARLLDRDSRGLSLTPLGEVLLGQARRLLRMNDDILTTLFGAEVAGEVRFGAPEDFATAYLPEILGRFAQANPKVQLNVTCDLTLNLLDGLQNGRLDLALIKRDPAEANLGVRVWREPLVWVGASIDILDRPGPLPVIVAPAPCVYRRRALSALGDAGREWRVAYVSPSLAGQHAALRAGLGVTALPRDMTPDDLAILDHALPKLSDTEIALLTAAQEPRPAVARLAEAIKQAMERHRRPSTSARAEIR